MNSSIIAGQASYQKNSMGLISVMEAENLVSSLEEMDVKEIGSKRWLKQHDALQKLNFQAHHNAMSGHDEYVKEALISYDKLKVLVHELLAIELWKHKVWDQVKESMAQSVFLLPYTLLYHEAVIVNLLEVIMYHQESNIALDESIIELVDFCHRKLEYFVNKDNWEDCVPTQDSNEDYQDDKDGRIKELDRQKDVIEFQCALGALSIVRYMTDYMHDLPIGVMNGLVMHHDFIAVFTRLITNPPWVRKSKQGYHKWIDNRWELVDWDDMESLTKPDAQLWLAMTNLIVDTEASGKYDWNTFKKESVFKVRPYVTDVLVDQIPTLVDLQRALDNLHFMEPPRPTEQSGMLKIETLPEIWDSLVNQDWDGIVSYQLDNTFSSSKDGSLNARQQEVQQLAGMYNLDMLDEVLEPPKCAKCGDLATNRCSRCHSEWYCGRECQVAAWKQHKGVCASIVELNKSLAEEEKEKEKEDNAIVIQSESGQDHVAEKKVKQFTKGIEEIE